MPRLFFAPVMLLAVPVFLGCEPDEDPVNRSTVTVTDTGGTVPSEQEGEAGDGGTAESGKK